MRALRDKWTLTSRLYDRSDEGHPEKRILDCSIGWQNYRDQYGLYWPCEPGHSEPDGDGFQAQFARIPRLIRLGEDGRKRVYPVPGNDQVWIQLFKPEELTLGRPMSKQGGVWTWDRPAYTFVLIVGPSGVKFKLVLKRPVGVNTLHIPFESQGLQRQGSQLLHNGEVVAVLRRPSVWHPGMSEDDEPIPVNVRFEPGVIVLEFDPTGMQYPVVIDPPLDLQVGATEDDGQIYNVTTPGTDGTRDLGAPIFGNISNTDMRYNWTRFTGVTCSGTVDVMYLTYTSTGNYSTTTVNSILYGNDTATPLAPTTVAKYWALVKTGISVNWDGVGSWTTGTEYNTPSLIGIGQELVDSYSYVNGEMQFMHWNDASSAGAFRRPQDYIDGDHTHGAKLHIESTAGAPPGIVPFRRRIEGY